MPPGHQRRKSRRIERQALSNKCGSSEPQRRLTGKLRVARSLPRQTKALYPEHRHSSSLTSPPARTLQRLLEGAPIEGTVRARTPKHNRATRTPPPKCTASVARARTRKQKTKGLGLGSSISCSLCRSILGATSNGEVEGPRAGARLEPRVHTVLPHPRRHYRTSRHPPTIVRAHAGTGDLSSA